MSDRTGTTPDKATDGAKDQAKDAWDETKGDLGNAFDTIKERAGGVVQDLTGDHESTTELYDIPEDERPTAPSSPSR
ncbi:MAG: hypothetical protein M3462_07635 [Chloroflexota bacterium]|nr:hypothetical protein [Chloroflexota bacterium]